MAYDEGVAQRVRETLADERGVTEQKMFGGLAFLLRGNMCCGVIGEELMLRVGPEGYDEALAQRHARPMDFTGRPMRGMVYVASRGFESDADLTRWVGRAADFARSLPPK
jgi:TfoX/Sxy family transcriptional regulator of competence genes